MIIFLRIFSKTENNHGCVKLVVQNTTRTDFVIRHRIQGPH